MLLNEMNISDGKIISFNASLQGLKLFIQDWEEQRWLIIFKEVLSFQSMSAEYEELSHLDIVVEDNFKKYTMEYFDDENPRDYLCFNFYGAWSDRALLKIIAKNNYSISKLSER
jgi:hypothetical protein